MSLKEARAKVLRLRRVGYAWLIYSLLEQQVQVSYLLALIQLEKINDRWITSLAKDAGVVVAAWGNDGVHLGRSKDVLKLISSPPYPD